MQYFADDYSGMPAGNVSLTSAWTAKGYSEVENSGTPSNVAIIPRASLPAGLLSDANFAAGANKQVLCFTLAASEVQARLLWSNFPAGVRTVSVSWWEYRSGSNLGGEKFCRVGNFVSGPGSNRGVDSVITLGQVSGTTLIANSANMHDYGDQAMSPGITGWPPGLNHFEAVYTLSTGTNADGSVSFYQNGSLIGHATGLQFFDTTGQAADGFELWDMGGWSSTGGGTEGVVTYPIKRYFCEIRVASSLQGVWPMTAVTQAANPIIIGGQLHHSPDGTLRTTNPNGDYNPQPATLACDAQAFAAAVGSVSGLVTGGTALNIGLRGAWLTGTEAGTCTFQVRTISGSDVATHNWAIAGANLTQSLVSGSIGAGTFAIDAVDSSGKSVLMGIFSWSIAAPVGTTDALAPSMPLFVTAQPNPASNNSIQVGFDPCSDLTSSDGTPPTGVDHYNVRRANGTIAATVAAILAKVSAATLYNIGGFSPAPTVVQSGGQFTITSAGTGQFGGLTEQYAFYAWQVSGAFKIKARVAQFSSSQQFSALGLMIRDDLAQGAQYLHWYLQPASPGNGLQAEYRTVDGGTFTHQNVSIDSFGHSIVGPLWLIIERGSDLTTLKLSYSLDGITPFAAFTVSIPMAQSVYVGIAAASLVAGTTFTGVVDEVSITNGPTLSTTFAATVSDTYTVEAVDVQGNVSGHLAGVTAAPIVPTVGTIDWVPGFKFFVGNLGGSYSSISSALADWKSQMSIVAAKNSSRICTGFAVGVLPKLLFPTTKGDWSNSQGISLFLQILQYMATLPNGPYTLDVENNLVANTYGLKTITAAIAQSLYPSWWYDGASYGPVSGDNHGGVYWNGSSPGLVTSRFWNATLMDENRQVWAAIYSSLMGNSTYLGLRASGYFLYTVDPTMEVSAAQAMRNAGYSDAALTNVLAGTTGIPNGFAKDMRAAMPKCRFNLRVTYPGSLSAVPAMLAAVYAAQWSGANYDCCAETKPADLPNGATRAFWIDLAHRGQTAVGGPVVTTNFKALGNDFQCNVVADELGHGTAAVPNAVLGTGRLEDILNHVQEMGASHCTIYAEGYSGPRCNTIGTYSGQPANYVYPAGGSAVAATDILAHLNALSANQYLNLNRPTAAGWN